MNRPLAPIEKYAQRWWVSFAMYDDVDRGTLTAMFADRLLSVIADKGYVPVGEPKVWYLDSRVDLIDPALRREDDEVVALASVRCYRQPDIA